MTMPQSETAQRLAEIAAKFQLDARPMLKALAQGADIRAKLEQDPEQAQ